VTGELQWLLWDDLDLVNGAVDVGGHELLAMSCPSPEAGRLVRTKALASTEATDRPGG
jgi:hypothetical protein